MRAMRIHALALLFLGACLIEQPLEEEGDEDLGRNHAPSIVLRSPSASVLHLQRDCELSFSLPQIEDLDRDDDLEVRWFVNYDDGNVGDLDTWHLDASEAEGTLRFTGNRSLRVDLEDYPDASTLVVEAVVSDGFADPGEPPLNRAVMRGRGQAVASWTIVISEGSWCNL